MARAAPQELRFDQSLPLAINSNSKRRVFFPSNGEKFRDPANGQNIIRMTINSDNFLDFLGSYFSLDLAVNFTSGAAAKKTFFQMDQGLPFIQRLRIESAGNVLEDIDEYGKLHAIMMQHQLPSEYSENVGECQGFNYNGHNNVTNMSEPQKIRVAGGLPAAGAYDAANIQVAATGAEVTLSKETAVTTKNLHYLPVPAVLASDNADAVSSVTAKTLGLGNELFVKTQATSLHGGNDFVADNYHFTFNFISGLFSQPKYFPLIFTSAGIDIEIHLADAYKIGAISTFTNGAVPAGPGDAAEIAARAAIEVMKNTPPARVYPDEVKATPGAATDFTYQITNFQYVANLIDLDEEFNMQMRQMMQSMGGILSLPATSYRHFQTTLPGGQKESRLNIPVRAKSIKSIYTAFEDTELSKDTESQQGYFQTSSCNKADISEYSYRIGSTPYPSKPIKAGRGIGNLTAGSGGNFEYGSAAESHAELMKSFGKFGDYSHVVPYGKLNWDQVMANPSTAAVGATSMDYDLSGGAMRTFLAGFDFENFARATGLIESGVNSSDRALPVQLELKREANRRNVGGALYVPTAGFDVHSYVLSDAIFYISLAGDITVSV